MFLLAHFGHHLLGQAILIPLLPFIRNEFASDYTQAGWLVTAFMVPYGISQLPAGWLTDRIGSRIVITMGVSGVALFGFSVGLAPSYIIMVIFLVLVGIMGGGYHPASIPVISSLVEPEKRGQALGLHQIGGTASHFVGPLIAGTFAATLGWRGTFIGTAIPIIILGIVFYSLLGRWRYKRKTSSETPESSVEAATVPVRSRMRRLIAFVTISVVGQILIFSVISFIPLFLVDNFNVSEESAAGMLAIVYAAGFWAGPLGGYLSDRLGAVPVLLAGTLISSPLIYLLNHVPYGMGNLFNLIPYGLGITALLHFIGVCLDSRMPVSEAYIISQSPGRHRSTILGVYYFLSRGGPGLITPLIGYLIDRSGFFASFTVIAVTIVAVTLVCSIGLWGGRNGRYSKDISSW